MSADPLDRLFRSASRSPRPDSLNLPPGFEHRLLAALREPHVDQNPWLPLKPVIRWALMGAVTCLIAAGGLGFIEIRNERMEDVSLDSAVMRDSAVTFALLR